jgi:hypothetical protein
MAGTESVDMGGHDCTSLQNKTNFYEVLTNHLI